MHRLHVVFVISYFWYLIELETLKLLSTPAEPSRKVMRSYGKSLYIKECSTNVVMHTYLLYYILYTGAQAMSEKSSPTRLGMTGTPNTGTTNAHSPTRRTSRLEDDVMYQFFDQLPSVCDG